MDYADPTQLITTTVNQKTLSSPVAAPPPVVGLLIALPDELIVHIFSQLLDGRPGATVAALGRLCVCCRRVQRTVRSAATLWATLLQSRAQQEGSIAQDHPPSGRVPQCVAPADRGRYRAWLLGDDNDGSPPRLIGATWRSLYRAELAHTTSESVWKLRKRFVAAEDEKTNIEQLLRSTEEHVAGLRQTIARRGGSNEGDSRTLRYKVRRLTDHIEQGLDPLFRRKRMQLKSLRQMLEREEAALRLLRPQAVTPVHWRWT